MAKPSRPTNTQTRSFTNKDYTYGIEYEPNGEA